MTKNLKVINYLVASGLSSLQRVWSESGNGITEGVKTRPPLFYKIY